MTKTILVTGAEGFLGRKIVELFSDPNYSLRSTDVTGCRPCDLVSCSENALDELVRDVSVVLHVAGFAHHTGSVTPDIRKRYFEINTEATRRIAEAAKKTGRLERFVFLSSGAVYGSAAGQSGRFDESSPCAPDDAYGESKREAEQILETLFTDTETALVILRMATLFGEEDPGNMQRLIDSINRNRFVWIDTGRSRKTFIHRDDAAKACLLAATETLRSKNSIYNVSGETKETREILTDIFRELGKPLPKIRIPGSLARFLSGTLSACCLHRGIAAKIHRSVVKWQDDKPYDGSRFEQDFVFAPTVSMLEGLKREVAWMQGTHSLTCPSP